MTKTLNLTLSIAVAVLGMAAASVPSQAATRQMSSSIEGFEYRCERHGGSFAQDSIVVTCQTPTVAVACEYFKGRQANCNWPGIENQINVIRVIGTLPGDYLPSTGGGSSQGGGGATGGGNGGGGGIGFQGPKDFKAPDNDPKPNFNGPKDFQMAP